MKKKSFWVLIGALMLSAVTSFADTDVTAQWNCTTNASVNTDEDKAAYEQMSNNRSSAADAFAMAVKNCRDCTKITCEVNK